MFSIYDGRDKFYQWDKDRKVIVYDETIKQVHFANCLCSKAIPCEVYTEGSIRVADVPDNLLTEYMDIRAWGYDSGMTKHEQVFEIERRPKPEDYIYTPEEKKTWEELEERITELEENGGSGDTPGSNLLVVTITGNVTEALTSSHKAGEIYNHFKNYGNVIAYLENHDEYISLNFSDIYNARFYVHQTRDGNVAILDIDEDGNVSFSVIEHATKKDITELEKNVGDIETALDTIIAIQNELIGGNS